MKFLTSLAFVALAASAPAYGQTAALPEGPGKQLVQENCTGCHEVTRITNASYSRDGWLTEVRKMTNSGAPIANDKVGALADYLAKAFPEQARPAAAVIAGPVQASFKEWTAPTPGSWPHDPLATPDGMIWYTGQFGNLLGRIDPKTGKITEFELKTAVSGPHGLTYDTAGNIWFASNFQGYMGKLDPKSGAITEYKMPDPKAKDVHTPLFDKTGMLFFTLQNANMFGRLDPKTGAIKLTTSPTPNSRPYGMVFDSKDTPWFCEFGSNKIAHVDKTTLAIKEYELPHKDSRPRRIAITPDDVIYYGDYSRGYLGRFDTKTGQIKEWPTPSGAKAMPYGITFYDGAIWYAESNAKPNTLVRFDIASEKFQSWKVPGGGEVIRNMMPTHDGTGIVLAESGVDKVALVTVAPAVANK